MSTKETMQTLLSRHEAIFGPLEDEKAPDGWMAAMKGPKAPDWMRMISGNPALGKTNAVTSMREFRLKHGFWPDVRPGEETQNEAK